MTFTHAAYLTSLLPGFCVAGCYNVRSGLRFPHIAWFRLRLLPDSDYTPTRTTRTTSFGYRCLAVDGCICLPHLVWFCAGVLPRTTHRGRLDIYLPHHCSAAGLHVLTNTLRWTRFTAFYLCCRILRDVYTFAFAFVGPFDLQDAFAVLTSVLHTFPTFTLHLGLRTATPPRDAARLRFRYGSPRDLTVVDCPCRAAVTLVGYTPVLLLQYRPHRYTDRRPARHLLWTVDS